MRKSVSVAFFSLMSTLLIFGTVIMGGSELVLFSNYFAQERYDVLDEVVNVAQRTASHLVQEAALPEVPVWVLHRPQQKPRHADKSGLAVIDLHPGDNPLC